VRGQEGTLDGEGEDIKPTKVHLQVFDGMCHVLTVFTFIDPAHYAYNAIGDFVKRVIDEPEDLVDSEPFPLPTHLSSLQNSTENFSATPTHSPPPETVDSASDDSQPTVITDEMSESPVDTHPPNGLNGSSSLTPTPSPPPRKLVNLHRKKKHTIVRAPFVDSMIRERVNISGVPRPMELESALSILRIPPSKIGKISESPVVRWLTGMQLYDKKYKRAFGKASRDRERNQVAWEGVLEHARKVGVPVDEWVEGEGEVEMGRRGAEGENQDPDEGEMDGERGHWVESRRWGPLDLKHERPPPTAICGRRDNIDSITLLRTSLQFSRQPRSDQSVPPTSAELKGDTSEALRDALNPSGKGEPPKLSAAEQQVRKTRLGSHGVKVWSGIMNHYYDRSKKKVKDSAKAAKRTATDSA